MGLTCEKLMEFNLVEAAEDKIIKNRSQLVDFFQLDNEIINIDQFIKDTPSFPGSTRKIMRNEMISAIGATLSIEGTALNNEDIEESLKKADIDVVLRRKEQEAKNSRDVYIFIKDLVKSEKGNLKYSEPVIKQLHACFTRDIDYVSNKPGDYRGDFPVTFGDPRKTSFCRTRGEIEEAMQKFVGWLNANEIGFLHGNTFVKAMMAHYYLTEIHPFGDGNGRTARALEALILNANRVNDYCFWSWANFWSAHRDQYFAHLHNIRITLDPLPFIFWGLEGYRDEINIIKQKVLKKVKQLMFSDYVQYLLRNKQSEPLKINKRIVDMLRLLMRREQISFKKFVASPEVTALYSNVAISTRTRDFKKLMFADMPLIKFVNSTTKDDIIEPNYSLLEELIYNV